MKKRTKGLFASILRKKQWLAILAMIFMIATNASDIMAYCFDESSSSTVYGDYGFTHYCTLYHTQDTYSDWWSAGTTHSNPNGYYFSKYITSCYSSLTMNDGQITGRCYADYSGTSKTWTIYYGNESFARGHAWCGCDGSRVR